MVQNTWFGLRTLGQQFAPGLQHTVRPAELGDHSHLLEEHSLPRLPADRRDHGQAVRVQLALRFPFLSCHRPEYLPNECSSDCAVCNVTRRTKHSFLQIRACLLHLDHLPPPTIAIDHVSEITERKPASADIKVTWNSLTTSYRAQFRVPNEIQAFLEGKETVELLVIHAVPEKSLGQNLHLRESR